MTGGMEAVRNMVPDEKTVTTLAAKMAAWGTAELSVREREILLGIVWRHASPHDRIRAENAEVLDADEEDFVTELESEFRRPE
ncbi:hypothetical protein RKD47_006709 [Streptomyces albogriseolus]